MRKLILLLFAGCTACSTGAAPQAAGPATPSTPVPRTGQAPQGAQSDTLARIRSLAANTGCSDDSQCHSLPLGTRACGGPESYLAWSSAHTPQAEIEALGERYKEERRAANAASGMMSTCQFMPDPGAVCRAGTCQLRQGATPAAM
jgi:hypothetical protein